MRKFLYIIFLSVFISFIGPNAFAEEPETLTIQAKTEFNWLCMSQMERDNIIRNYKNIIFGEDTVYKYKKKDFKKMYKEFVKDEAYKTHYIETQEGITETNSYRLSGFFKGKILICYAIQYKNNPQKVYYYDALGHLKFVDVISENYPNFPYWSLQYKIDGDMISAIYIESKDLQYMYKPNGDFIGVWFKDKRFTRDAKQDLTRSNW